MAKDWIAIHWNNHKLSAWQMQGDQGLVTRLQPIQTPPQAPAEHEELLLSVITDWLAPEGTDVILCGPVISEAGWLRPAHRMVPCTPLPDQPLRMQSSDPRLRLWAVPALGQSNPADLSGGAETALAGFLAEHADWDGVICVPGQRTRWAHISANEVVSFQTFLTGEIQSHLATSPTLSGTVGAEDWDKDAFEQAVADGLARPERVAAKLFSLRASALLGAQDRSTASARLSGWLIGAELAATRPYWLGQNLAVIGEDRFANSYASALRAQGLNVLQRDDKAAYRAGLTQCWQKIGALV